MKYYQIPKLFQDQTIFIFGGGPSLPSSIKGKDFSNVPVIGVNNAFRFPNVDVLWFADSRFYWWYRKEIDAYKGLKISYNRHPELLGSLVNVPDINVPKGRPGAGIAEDRVQFNASSGGSAINVAYLLGAKRIVLVGYDMQAIDGEYNWWKYKELPKTPKGYDNFIKPFTRIKEDAEARGLEILNATPNSALTMFESVGIDAYIK